MTGGHVLLDRQHLAILREVDRQGGVTAAADRLNMTQSAVSHAIRRLERGPRRWLQYPEFSSSVLGRAAAKYDDIGGVITSLEAEASALRTALDPYSHGRRQAWERPRFLLLAPRRA